MSDSRIEILLADDDRDDCLFFKDALDEIGLSVSFTAVNDGDQLMRYLYENKSKLPGVLFLDINMPRKNGYSCLAEIKNEPELRSLPVIIFSTSYDESKAMMLREIGAHYYICKPADFGDLKNVIKNALELIQRNNKPPAKEKFLLTAVRMIL